MIMMAVFYPFTVVAIAAGFIAFILLVLKVSPPVVSAVVLGFYAVSVTCLYAIFRPVVGDLGIGVPLLGFILVVDVLAVVSIILVILEWIGGRL